MGFFVNLKISIHHCPLLAPEGGATHLHNAIPIAKALVAGLAVGELAGEAAGALVAADARHPLLTDAVSRLPVALGRLDAAPVAVTGCGEEEGCTTAATDISPNSSPELFHFV